MNKKTRGKNKMISETKLEKAKNGNLIARAKYKGKEIEIKLGHADVVIGQQKDYEIVDEIDKDKVPKLYQYLNEQRDIMMDRVKKAKEVIKETEGIENKDLSSMAQKIDKKKLSQNNLKQLENYAKDIYMLNQSRKQIGLMKDNLSKIEYQIKFIKDNYEF